MNKKKAKTKKKATKPGDAKIKLGVSVTGNPKLNKPNQKRTK
ncbi:MAG TPA: hypothetical protein PLD84_00665 [Chitinophagales bacterium]|nr:hypothetical protein [Chitinophagales bacterium]